MVQLGNLYFIKQSFFWFGSR